MDFVIDANILFAALIKDSDSIELIFNENMHLFAPEFLFEEFNKHKEEILNKTKRNTQEFNEILEILKMIITIVPKEEFYSLMKEADIISPDKDDVAYFALALNLKIPIWSNDKKLKSQKRIQILNTQEIKQLIT